MAANASRPGAMSYEDLLLGLTVNAETYDLEEEPRPVPAGGLTPETTPFDVSQIASYDFTLNPTNFSTRLGKGAYHAFLDWWQVSTWYPYNTNLVDVYEKKHGKTFRPTSLIQRLKFNPYEGKRRGMVRVPSSSTKVHCEAKLALLKREHGITLRPVEVDGDGNCLVHSASVGLTGTQRYFDALRFAIYRELRDHRDHYLSVGVASEQYKARFEGLLAHAQQQAAEQGLMKQSEQFRLARENLLTLKVEHTRPRYSAADVSKALQQVRPCLGEVVPQEKYLEEIHITALANVLRRPVILLAGEYEGGFFLPSRLDPQECVTSSGVCAPPFMIHFLGLHYEHLALQREQDYWRWAEETVGKPYPDVMDVLRKYADSMLSHPRVEQKRRMPEFVEELVLYALAHAAMAIEKRLDETDTPRADRAALHDAFGNPPLFESVLGPALGPESKEDEDQPPSIHRLEEGGVREVRCPDGVIDHPEMSATFRCLGIEVRQDGDSHYMHVLLDKVDVEKVKLVMWALYALQGTPLSPANTDKPGLIKTDDNLDSEVFDLVMNGLNEPIVDLGVAHLYGSLEGFDFNTMSDRDRDPRPFVEEDERRLRLKFHRLTGTPLGQVLSEDGEKMRREKTDIAEIRMLYTHQRGAFTRVPTGLLTMLKVASERAYPGLALVHPSQVELLEYVEPLDDSPAAADPEVSPMAPRGRKRDARLDTIALQTSHQRLSVLEQLASRYGLPQDSKYEVAYCSVLAPERFSEARARAVLLDWVSSSLRQGVRSVKKVFLPGNPVLVSQVVLTPTSLLPPLNEKAEEERALMEVLPPSPNALMTGVSPTKAPQVRAPTPTQEEVKAGGEEEDHHPHLLSLPWATDGSKPSAHTLEDDDEDDDNGPLFEQELGLLSSRRARSASFDTTAPPPPPPSSVLTLQQPPPHLVEEDEDEDEDGQSDGGVVDEQKASPPSTAVEGDDDDDDKAKALLLAAKTKPAMASDAAGEARAVTDDSLDEPE